MRTFASESVMADGLPAYLRGPAHPWGNRVLTGPARQRLSMKSCRNRNKGCAKIRSRAFFSRLTPI